MNTQNSFSELIDKFILLQNNALSVLQKINEAVASDEESISFTLKDMNDEEVAYELPSFGYIKENLDRIDNTLKTLMGYDGQESLVRMPDGTHKRLFTTKVAREPDQIQNLTVPATFEIKPNWFFESFLSPSLHISFDVSGYISETAKRILYKKVIIVADSPDQENYFDLNYKGKNDIDINLMYDDLVNKEISFHEDEQIQELPLSILEYEGKFDVYDIKDIQVTKEGEEVTVRHYYLNKLTYDSLTGVEAGETLKTGDKLLSNETIYEITSIDTSINAITLKRLSGYDPISIKAESLKLYSESFAPRRAEIGINYNERQVIFFKPIDEGHNIMSRSWSPGVAIYSNDLVIETEEGEMNLRRFYNQNVLDFGKTILASAKEKTVPSIYGEIPDVPNATNENFRVVQINDHLFDSKEREEIKRKASNKIELESEIKQLDSVIQKNKEILGNTQFKTEQERTAVKNKLDSLIREKTSKTSLYSSVVLELVAIARDVDLGGEKPKYRIRGFVDIPPPKYNENTGPQEVIQFEYTYRYLRIDDKPSQAQQLEFEGRDGQKKRGSFSPWVTKKSDIRKRYYDYGAGVFKWSSEDVEDADAINTNQLEIPIKKGEKVELQVRCFSEAGWPINPIASDWSDSIIIDFPEDLMRNDFAELALSQALAEESLVKFEESLNAKNLDLHLKTSRQTGDEYFSHSADTISSGFYDQGGLVINLYEKIKNLKNEIETLQSRIEQRKGELQVSIVEEGGGTAKRSYVKNGSTVELFAGYYRDFIEQLAVNERKGAIITKVYNLIIENTERTPLELVSMFPGGLSERLYEEEQSQVKYDPDYYDKLRYWEVPINNLAVAAEETKNCNGIYAGNVQSRQLRSQFLYLRKTNVGLVKKLYKTPNNEDDRYFVPDFNGTGESLGWIWNGSISGNTPDGSGNYSDFCIHTDCPILYPDNESEWNFSDNDEFDWMKFFNQPDILIGEGSSLPEPDFKASAFRHSKYFNLQSMSKDGKVQLSFKDPWAYDSESGECEKYEGDVDEENKYTPELTDLPDKLGFYPHDRYFVGKNTCGSYLFMGPAFFDQLLIEGADHRSKKEVDDGEANAIMIPIVFQFRMVDYFGDTPISGRVAGDKDNTIVNVIYNKTIGVDISVKNESRFSFDVDVSAKYSRRSPIEKLETTENVLQKPSIMIKDKRMLRDL